jgi:hypothetical protein
VFQVAMAFDVPDAVWSTMDLSELHSPSDIAEKLKHPVESVSRVLEFLERYDLVERDFEEMRFRRIAGSPSSSEIFWTISAAISNPLPGNPLSDDPVV